MTGQIYIWNSMARRRRSASDIFEDNGLHILKSYLQANGYHSKVIDWATKRGYNSLSPYWLRMLNHWLLIISNKNKNKWLAKLSGKTQVNLGQIQEKRFKKKLRKLAKTVAKEKVKVLGIKVWYGEAFSMSKYLCEQVNKYSPNTMVIAGGYHASLYEEDILQHSNFDLAVAGNGEKVRHLLYQWLLENYDV